ncbi:MAG: armadillo-type protein [Benniella sp.]|nr:MAG: armadillo-type protein [Benniella sp.]
MDVELCKASDAPDVHWALGRRLEVVGASVTNVQKPGCMTQSCECEYGTDNQEFRLMTLNDLITEPQSPNFSLGESTERKVVRKILLLLKKDKNGVVQNQAVKWSSSDLDRSRDHQPSKANGKHAVRPLGSLSSCFAQENHFAVGHLVAHLPDDIFEDLLHKILNGLETSKNTPDRLRTYIQVTGAISGSNAPRFGMFLSRVAPLVIKYTELDDDELRRNALQALEAFVLRCSTEITPHIDTIIDLGLKFLRHDPNYDHADDGEDDEDETMESDNEDDEVDDDDGSTPTWHLYTNVAPSLINRFKEHEETVLVEIIQTLITLLRQTNSYAGAQYEMDTSLESIANRRKGSRPGTPIETDQSPKVLLRSQVPRLAKNLAKQMSSKSVQTRVSGYILLKKLVTVLKGGLETAYILFVPSIQLSLSTASHADTTTWRVSAADADQEVKEHSILCLGVLLSRCHVLAMSSTGIDDVPAAVAREASE